VATDQNTDQPVRSPLAGCLIFIIIVVVVIFVISFAAYSFKKQAEGFASFSESTETKTTVSAALSFDEELKDFGNLVATNTLATLSFNVDQLNGAIAHYSALESLRGQLYVTKIQDSKIHAQLHLPLASTKDLPGLLCKALSIEQRDNFLQSQIIASPLLSDGELFLQIDSLTPSRGEAPEQLTQAISPFRIFPDLDENSSIKTTLAKITGVEVNENQIHFLHSPGATPPSGKTEGNAMAEKARHLIALGALIFILTMILVFIFLAKRKKAAQSNTP